MTNMLAPFVKIEENIQFYLNGRTYEVNENNIEIIERPTNNKLLRAIDAFNSFEIVENTVRWFHGSTKFIYNIEESTFQHGTMNIRENFTNHVLASGTVRYQHKGIAELFESLPTVLENIFTIDFASTYTNEGVTVDVFKLDENVFVSRYNENTKLSKFFKTTANEAVSYVKAETNQDATQFVIEMLEGELAEEASKNTEISKFNEMISFLKDQRGLLAEADKTIEEIKAADSLINSEIKVWESKIVELTSN